MPDKLPFRTAITTALITAIAALNLALSTTADASPAATALATGADRAAAPTSTGPIAEPYTGPDVIGRVPPGGVYFGRVGWRILHQGDFPTRPPRSSTIRFRIGDGATFADQPTVVGTGKETEDGKFVNAPNAGACLLSDSDRVLTCTGTHSPLAIGEMGIRVMRHSPRVIMAADAGSALPLIAEWTYPNHDPTGPASLTIATMSTVISDPAATPAISPAIGAVTLTAALLWHRSRRRHT